MGQGSRVKCAYNMYYICIQCCTITTRLFMWCRCKHVRHAICNNCCYLALFIGLYHAWHSCSVAANIYINICLFIWFVFYGVFKNISLINVHNRFSHSSFHYFTPHYVSRPWYWNFMPIECIVILEYVNNNNGTCMDNTKTHEYFKGVYKRLAFFKEAFTLLSLIFITPWKMFCNLHIMYLCVPKLLHIT